MIEVEAAEELAAFFLFKNETWNSQGTFKVFNQTKNFKHVETRNVSRRAQPTGGTDAITCLDAVQNGQGKKYVSELSSTTTTHVQSNAA